MNRQSPEVSIIIVNYNGEKFLTKLLSSISQQSINSSETIIIDNGSTDGSLKLLSKISHPHQLIKSENIGYGRGCNLGAKAAKGKYLVFLNPDTYLDPHYLKNIIKNYQHLDSIHHHRLGCINSNIRDFGKTKNLASTNINSIIDIFGNPRGVTSKSAYNDSFVILGTGLFISRQVFNQISGFNPSIFLYGEELDLCWRLKNAGYFIASVDGPILYHQGSGSFGKNRAKQLAYMTYGSFIAAFTNYQLISLLFVTPLYFLYLVFLIIFMPLYLKFDFHYDLYLCQHFYGFFSDLPKILQFRRFAQSKRTVSDLSLRQHFSLVPTMVVNFFRLLTSTNTFLSQKNGS